MAIEPIYGMYVHDEVTNTDGVAKFSSEELEDIRVGADGTTYANAGDAVRGQVGDLKYNLSYVNKYIGSYDDSILTVDNSYIDNQGYSGTRSNFHRSELLPIQKGIEKIALLYSGQINGCAVAFYSQDTITHGYFISGVSVSEHITPSNTIDIPIPSNAKYMVFSCRKSTNFLAIYGIENVSDTVLESAVTIDRIIHGITVDYIDGYVRADGGIETSGNNSNYYSTEIDKKTFETIEISCDSGYQFNICTYSNGAFVSRSSWYSASSGIIELDNSYDYRINIATVSSGTDKTISEMLEHFTININGDDIATLERNIYSSPSVDWLSKIMACQASGKVIHFSFDDVWEVLYDLTTTTPTSIWDNATLASLKAVHDATGACFTFNVFNSVSTQADYDIANVPNTWASEWQQAKDWLRFAFHAKDDNTNYATATTGAEDYTYFVNAVYSFTGDYGCIDTVTRLSFFVGTLRQIENIKNCEHGIIGLLTADDTRLSYYFNQTQNDQVNKHGRLFDNNNMLLFVKSLPRIDSNSSASQIAYIESIANVADKYVEVFSHNIDTDRLSRIQTVSAWANEHGFTNGFLMDYFS